VNLKQDYRRSALVDNVICMDHVGNETKPSQVPLVKEAQLDPSEVIGTSGHRHVREPGVCFVLSYRNNCLNMVSVQIIKS